MKAACMNTRCVSPVRAPSLNAGASAARMRLSRDPPEQLSQESVVFSGLNHPSAVRFASDGRVFVAEKNGLIEVFDNLSDTSATVFADLRQKVHVLMSVDEIRRAAEHFDERLQLASDLAHQRGARLRRAHAG